MRCPTCSETVQITKAPIGFACGSCGARWADDDTPASGTDLPAPVIVEDEDDDWCDDNESDEG